MFDPAGRLNISTLEDGADSKMNHPKEGGNDMDVTKLDDGLDGEDNTKIKDKAKDPLSMPQGPITRSRSKKP